MSLPASLPEFFVDRSLGRVKVPKILRAAGLRLQTLAEVYGVPQDQDVADVTWLQLAGESGLPVLMKDGAIAVNPAEIAVVREFNVQCFTLARQDLPAYLMAAWFLMNLDEIVIACSQPGPYVYSVKATKLELIA